MARVVEHYPGMACDLGQFHTGACEVNAAEVLPAADAALQALRRGIDQALAVYGLPTVARNALLVAIGEARQILREGRQ